SRWRSPRPVRAAGSCRRENRTARPDSWGDTRRMRTRQRKNGRESSAPPPQAAHVVVQHQEFLEHHHALALAAEFTEQLPQAAAPGHVEPERLGEVFLWMCAGVATHEVGERGGDAAPLEIHPVLIRHPVRLAHLAEGAAEAPGAGPGPVMIEER